MSDCIREPPSPNSSRVATDLLERLCDDPAGRDKILIAAGAAFTAPGAEVSMAGVARRAGVGMAFLYRNYPGRRELLEALYTDEVDTICQAAEAIDIKTPGAAFLSWLSQPFAADNQALCSSTQLAHVFRLSPGEIMCEVP